MKQVVFIIALYVLINILSLLFYIPVGGIKKPPEN